MRTLQEKYNGIQEGKFSKEHFLAEARMQQPQLITRFNGYDDAVQILKNRGMIVEAKKEDGKKVTDHPFIVYTDKKGKHQLDEFNYEDDLKAFTKTIPNTWDVYATRKEASAELNRRLKENPEKFVKEEVDTKTKFDIIDRNGNIKDSNVTFFPNGKDYRAGSKLGTRDPHDSTQPSKIGGVQEGGEFEHPYDDHFAGKTYEPGFEVTFRNKNSGKEYKGTVVQNIGPGKFTFRAEDGKVYNNDGMGSNWQITKILNNNDPDADSGFGKWGKLTPRQQAQSDNIYNKIQEAAQPKPTKKGLADYRYKPTNEMDKYPYEQILRGIRVELEAAGVHGTPTAEEYAKALSKVSKNLAKDSIFYTNQVAGVNPKVDLHDKMVPFTEKAAVDTFNGMKKAELKEGFKKLIKKVLSETVVDVEDYTKEPEEEFELQEEDALEESKVGDLHILAQEANSLKDFLIAVKQQHPEIDLRGDIEDLKFVWDNKTAEVDELSEGKKSLSELLK